MAAHVNALAAPAAHHPHEAAMSTSTTKFKAKQFRVATEGATTDGRKIERTWIEQMAANYDRKKYGARVWLEHLRGLYPDSSFRAYGDVLSLEAREVEDGKLALFATIEPLPDLVAMTTKAKQKIFTSIEVNPKFADTGEAYLTGLAVTDSPASLGTEVLEFAAKNPAAHPYAGRKSSPDCLFSAAQEVEMSFEPDASEGTPKFAEQLKALVQRFTGRARTDDERFSAVLDAMESFGEHATAQAERLDGAAKDLKDLQGKFAALEASQTEMRKLLDTQDSRPHSQRPPATGGSAAQQTDC